MRYLLLALALVACVGPSPKRSTLPVASQHKVGSFVGPGFVHQDHDTLATLGNSAVAGQTAVYDGSKFVALQPQNDYAGKHFEWVDEFIYANPNSSNGTGPWLRLATGTGTSSLNLTGTATGARIGIVDFATGSTATGSVSWNLDQGLLDLTTQTVTEESTIGLNALSSGTDEFEDYIGLADTNNTINLTNGCGFLYDRGNVATGGPNSTNEADWECVCANAGVRTMYVMDGTAVSDESFTTVAAPVQTVTFPSTNGWTTLKLVVTPGVRAEFYVAEGSGYVKSCDIATNIPNATTRTVGPLLLHIKSAGTTSRLLYVDRHRLAVDLPSARSL